jgi:hypothetical protein
MFLRLVEIFNLYILWKCVCVCARVLLFLGMYIIWYCFVNWIYLLATHVIIRSLLLYYSIHILLSAAAPSNK